MGALRDRLPDLEPAGVAAGLHLVAHLPADLDERTLVDAAARRGVALYGLAQYRIAHAGRPGLIFGYATLDERVGRDALDRSVDRASRGVEVDDLGTEQRLQECSDVEDLWSTSVRAARENGLVEAGDRVVITAGTAVNIPGSTNVIKVEIA